MWKVYLIRSIPWIKKNLEWIISAIVIIWIASWIHNIKATHRRQVYELEQVNILVRRMMVNQWEKDSLSIVKKAEENEELKGILESQVKATVKFKDLYLREKARATITDTTALAEFTKETKCHFAWGWTKANLITGESEYNLSVVSQPVNLQIDITKIKKGEIFGRVKASSDCLEIGKVKFNVPPELDLQVEYKTDWKTAGVIFSLGVALGFFILK